MKGKTITVSRAISKIKSISTAAVLLMIVTWMSLIASGIWPLLLLAGALLSFILFKIFMSWYIIKWKIWAFTHVDDIYEFVIKAQNLNIISSVFPGKWAVASKKEKEKLSNIIIDRMNYDPKKNFDDKSSIPPTMTITGSRKNNFILFIICAIGMWLPAKRVISESSNYPENDYGMILILSLLGLHLLLKTVEPNTKIILSNHGIWTKKWGFQKWDVIESIYFDDQPNASTNNEIQLIIKHNGFHRPKKSNLIQHFNLTSLGINQDNLEKALKVYLTRHQEQSIKSGQMKTMKDSKEPSKPNLYVIYLIPVVLALAATFLYFRSSRNIDEFDQITGRISFIGSQFGKNKNPDYKFIQLDSEPMAYQFFIGRGKWDFKAEYENLNALNINDTITIFSDDRWIAANENPEERLINKHVRFVSKNGTIFFNKGQSGKIPAYMLFAACLLSLLFILAVNLKSKLQR